MPGPENDNASGSASDKPKSRLVVFIDDVDRCEPEAAYRLLEGLKIYLTLDNCVFVLGMNQKAVEEAIAKRMGTNDHPATHAAAYMEKLCQNVWRLPAIREPNKVLDTLLKETAGEPVRKWIKPEEEKIPCLPPNPRRLKGLANLIGRLSSRLPAQEGESDETMIFEARLLVVVAYIYQFHHDLFVRWETDPDLYDRIYDWCNGSDPDLPFLKSLVLPQRRKTIDSEEFSSEESASMPSAWSATDMESTYPDPTEASVFWIQPLILKLGRENTHNRFERYLHGAST